MFLGQLGAVLGCLGCIFSPSGRVLEASWAPPRASWEGLGGLLRRSWSPLPPPPASGQLRVTLAYPPSNPLRVRAVCPASAGLVESKTTLLANSDPFSPQHAPRPRQDPQKIPQDPLKDPPRPPSDPSKRPLLSFCRLFSSLL